MPTTRRPEAREGDWRAAASPEELREYDAFGPWIEEVTSPELMPPRFRQYYDELRTARLLLKVPRNVERRTARPGQDLYAAVLAVHDDHLTLLGLPDRAQEPVMRRDVDVRDVVALSELTDLLIGRWSLLLRDGTRVDLGHSSVSREKVEAATDLLRARIVTATQPRSVGAPRPAEVEEFAFRTMLIALERRCDATVVPVHVEPRNALRRDVRGRLILTSGLMLVDAGEELVVVDGGPPRRPWRGPTYARTTTFVRYDQLTGFSVIAPQQVRQVHELVLVAGRQELRLACTGDPAAVVDLLTSRGLRRASARP